MQLSAENIYVLSNLSQINTNIVFYKDDPLCCIRNSNKSIFAVYESGIEIGEDAYIGDVLQLIKTAGILGDKAEMEFGDDKVTIKSGSEKIDYIYSDKSTMCIPKNNDYIDLGDSPDLRFSISKEVIEKIHKLNSLLKLNSLNISSSKKNDKIKLFTDRAEFDGKEKNKYSVKIDAENSIPNDFNLVFNIAYTFKKLIPESYDCEFFVDKKVLKLFNPKHNVTYYIAISTESTGKDINE